VPAYTYFKVYDPKVRSIQALPFAGRVVQHLICDKVLWPHFDKRLIYDNAACRKNKGTDFAIKRLRQFLSKQTAQGWYLKIDIKKYFASVNHSKLKSMLTKEALPPDINILLNKIIDSYSTPESKKDDPCGLPMGNMTSQLFALFYLDPVDRLIKEKLRVKHYIRYMDDLILLHSDKVFLQECLVQITTLCQDLKLELNSKTQIGKLANGFGFLGWHFRLLPSGKIIQKLTAQAKRNKIRKLKKLQNDYSFEDLDTKEVMQRVQSHIAHLDKGDSYNFKLAHIANKVWSTNRDATIKNQRDVRKINRASKKSQRQARAKVLV
jgi:retron-type reverse transcriptase